MDENAQVEAETGSTDTDNYGEMRLVRQPVMQHWSVTEEMNTVPVVWGFLTGKNQYLYQRGVIEPLRKKMEEMQDKWLVHHVNEIEAGLDEHNGVAPAEPQMVLAPVDGVKTIVCDFERAIVVAIK